MTTKNLGPLVSGYRNPDGRAWEQVVYQAGKPILDAELNLEDDLSTDPNRINRIQTSPSGWVSGSFLDSSDPSADLFLTSVAPNLIAIPSILALVNGWRIPVTNTNIAGYNVLDLGASPAGVAAHREDLIILEVWRRLIPPSPSGTGKSAAGRIWNNGNVKVAPADDLALNFADDILDTMVGAETTKRVQIQYRLRVIQDVDVYAYPYGIDDAATVFANSVPAAPAAPDGVATAFNYTNLSPNGDQGLWRAGDGNPANALGTVDGYMYGLPLMAVVRRNTSAFDRNTNHNGGVASPGPSDRPDGLFYDVFSTRDIIDLRMGVSPSGWDFQEVLEKNFNALLDNKIRTEIGSTLIGGSVNGNTVLIADDIGISNANGGDGITTGDTPGANLIGQFDAVLRRFSDRPQTETVVLVFAPTDQDVPGPVWTTGNTITISPSALPVYQEGTPFNWAAYAPANITFAEYVIGWWMGSGGASPSFVVTPTNIQGLGAVPQGAMNIDIGFVPGSITNEPMFLMLRIQYPSGLGLTKTPTDVFPDSLYYNNPGQLPAGAPVLYSSTEGFEIDPPHREVTLTYRTVDQVLTMSPLSASVVILPERVYSITSVTINAVPDFSYTVDATGYFLTFGTVLVPGVDTLVITYSALRPFPQNDEQVTIYYEARIPQTTRDLLLGGATLPLNPRAISHEVHSLTVGSGSEDEAYPFPYQYVQAGAVYPTSLGVFSGDHELDGSASVSVTDFDATTGYLRLPTFVGYVPAPDEIKFERTPGDIDGEGRSFFPTATFGLYQPNAYGQDLSDPVRHKVLFPFLAEMTQDTPWAFQGQLVLVVLSRWATFDAHNGVEFNPDLTQNTTSAAVYRIKGNLLNRRVS